MASAAGHIEWEYFDRETWSALRPGAYISSEAGGLPIYKVMRIDSGRAWLRDIESGADRVASLGEFHWRVCNPMAWV